MKSRDQTARDSAASPRQPPFVGALLRMTYEAARRRQLQAQKERGFTDLNQAHLSVLVFPPPDGDRPTDMAERTSMTKQAMNYLLGQLESFGYLERRARNRRGRRLVYLTQRGWQFYETQWAAMQQLEVEWAGIIGRKRFEEFMSVLTELASLDHAQPAHGARAPQGRANAALAVPKTRARLRRTRS